jgi:pyrroline-5-carboxylate reductase
VHAGFDRRIARELSRQVLLAAARLLENEHPAALKDEVASAGGTAIAGILQLEAHGLRYATIRAVEEASLRAAALRGEE